MWYYGFITFLSKQILQALWIEMVGFPSQNYITHHNNLVNMIVLLESFPTSKSLCIWNKLYASFYLKMLWTCHFSKFWMKCSLSNFHRGIVGSLSLFLVFRIMLVLNSKFCRELRAVLHKPLVEEEGVKVFRCGLAKLLV